MALTPPTPNIEPGFKEELTPERIAEVFSFIQGNFDYVFSLFPLQGSNLAKQLSTGSSTVSVPKESAISNPITISHELGRVPSFVDGNLELPEGYAIAFDCHVIERTKTLAKVQFVGSAAVPAALAVPVLWIATT